MEVTWEWERAAYVTPERNSKWEQQKNQVLSTAGLEASWSNQLFFISVLKEISQLHCPSSLISLATKVLVRGNIPLKGAQQIAKKNQDEASERLLSL